MKYKLWHKYCVWEFVKLYEESFRKEHAISIRWFSTFRWHIHNIHNTFTTAVTELAMNQDWLFTLDPQCRPDGFVCHGIWICDISTAQCSLMSWICIKWNKYICHVCIYGDSLLQVLLWALGYLLEIHINNNTVHQYIFE